MEFGANAAMCRALEIKKLPFCHIYKGGVGRITGFACGPSKFPLLVEKIDQYLQMSNEELVFEKQMGDGEALGNAIVKDLKQEVSTVKKDSATTGSV